MRGWLAYDKVVTISFKILFYVVTRVYLLAANK